mgnify:CR=1 FL=1
MKYYKVNFSIGIVQEMQQDARDVLMAIAGEAGFETFEETTEGVTGYVQQSLFSQSVLDALLADFPLPATIRYEVSEAEERDWNEEWEKEGFDPITVGSQLVVHDGRHTGDKPLEQYHYVVEIDARMAFGTGTHETTKMMLSTLLEQQLDGKRVLDCGCGTGILAIAALKMGATAATGYDIDEWSADNTRHNAVTNQVDDRLRVVLGDARVLEDIDEQFDIVLANINRNILLADMSAFHSKMKPNGKLVLSGFYADDIPLLIEKAGTLGLSLSSQRSDKDWASIVLE